MSKNMKFAVPSVLVLILALFIALYFHFFNKNPKPQPLPKFEAFTNRTNLVVWTATPPTSPVEPVFHGITKLSRHLNHTVTSECEKDGNWDIMWTHEYYFDKFTDRFRTTKLKDHQMVNHVPSITFLTNKLHLSISTTSRYIPSSFNFPSLKNEFLYFAKVFPQYRYVMKNMDRGGIVMALFEEVNINMGSYR
jgi:hypothetical protein